MLSSTYVQVAMQLENDRLREDVALLKNRVTDFCDNTQYPQDALEKLLQFASQLRRTCCLRRLEVHFFPVMRKQTPESELLMANHETLHQSSVNLHASICLCLYQALKEGADVSAALKSGVEQYCRTMSRMLETENDIFLLAQEVISRESWFSLARIFIWEEVDDIDRHVIIDLDNDDLENHYLLPTNESNEKADSGLKYKPADRSGLQSPEVSSLHFGNGQLPLSNLTRVHGRPAVQQTHLQNS